MPAREIVLDGEAIALRPDGTRSPSRSRCAASAGSWTSTLCGRKLPITPIFFDALYLDGDPLVDEPLTRRIAALLGEQSSPGNLVPRIVTPSADDAAAFAARRSGAGMKA